MFGLEFLGRVFGILRQPPDLIKEDIDTLCICIKHLGVSEKDISRLSRKIASSDGVVITEDFHQRIMDECFKQGHFRVMVSNQHSDSYRETLLSHPSVSEVDVYVWERITKYFLKGLFPEVFAELHYCSSCDENLKEEGAFCVNNGCVLAVQNLREANEKLIESQTLKEVLPEWKTKKDGAYTYHCICHDINITSDEDPDDDDGGIPCPGCDVWISQVGPEDWDDE